MKCPKCLYIGFETGDRCKNCGYDFSLLALAEDEASDVPDLPLHQSAEPAIAFDVAPARSDAWTAPVMDRFRDAPEPEAPALALSFAGPGAEIEPPSRPAPAALSTQLSTPPAFDEAALPLFEPDAVDDEPLVKLPAVPRVPLSVRKTPDAPRPRPVPSFDAAPLHQDAVLEFVEEPQAERVRDVSRPAPAPREPANRPPRDTRGAAVTFRADARADADVSPFGRRLVAATIDHGILLGIDFVVIYFTLRLTGLTLADWMLLPVLPMAAFLLTLKIAYLSAFTTAGGQTIGKMATNIRVVSDDGGRLDPGRALRRAVLGLVSIATAGAPFLAALGDPARRGVHDRASGTRVVALAPR
jgi:uncharacterized RDD family membrane protein YckC